MKDKEYLINRVTTANGPQLVAILYEEIIATLEEAICLMEQQDEIQLKLAISKSKDILAELLSTLEGASEITANLRNLYMFVNRLLTEGINHRNANKLRDAIKVLTPLYEGWKQLGEEAQAASRPQQGTTRVTGLTYGKNQLNDYIIEEENRWKKG